jgi:hypothetical protein
MPAIHPAIRLISSLLLLGLGAKAVVDRLDVQGVEYWVMIGVVVFIPFFAYTVFRSVQDLRRP